MTELLHELIEHSAARSPQATALRHRQTELTYADLAERVASAAAGLVALGTGRAERVAVYLPKTVETVVSFFAAAAAGAVFVPVNPILKAPQVGHILRDCNARVLITSRDRLASLGAELENCHDLHTVLLIDSEDGAAGDRVRHLPFSRLFAAEPARVHRVIDTDMVSILYTSGSTGRPKGVVLSHRNMVTGAASVSSYLGNTADDRLLAVLPFSFDYGFSQLSTAFRVGASVDLLEYLLPRDVIRAVDRGGITGLAAVPPLWIQLAELDWPEGAQNSLRYWTNSGGAMPGSTLSALRERLPRTNPILMYGLTEAFRSTYLPPEELDRRPGSMGKAIPNAEIMVVREDGSECAADEPGELVHRGSLVALGYWNDPEKTAVRFKPAPAQSGGLTLPETAVWSGDTVKKDKDGFLYFVGRRDEMIKTSGYRVSPTEVEEVIYQSGLVGEAAAMGVKHAKLGQAILLVVKPNDPDSFTVDQLMAVCRQQLPAFMVPTAVAVQDDLPRNANGKIDRARLSTEYADYFDGEPA